ncbi:hypothetical protein AAMO2058_000593100 [Amorphochlora amoebiformis]|mmetsp:Transcript_1227/g.1710  ORF Transcript_1227/g.1710 Transcript_1227/m.1710 type:complete len:185 (-) Transcript_1227:41-595(-)
MAGVGDKKLDWKKINGKLPYARDKKSKEIRMKMFRAFDPNGNGYLSLAELDKGIRDVLGLHDDVFKCKPAIMQAYKVARAKGKAKSKVSGDYVEKHEFRYFLYALRQYFEYWVMFDRADKNDDRRIDLAEFKNSAKAMEAWGVKILDPKSAFKSIDKNGGGFILFNEFCDFAIALSLDLEDDED